MMFKQIAADIAEIKWEYKDNTLFLEIKGYLRSAGYSLREPKVKFNEKERKISISLTTQKTENIISTQALVPFTKKIEFSISSKGTWQVFCNGKAITIDI
ncbi:MAG: hypothetical protein K9W45_11640 [Candidatus Heimdallarchaeum aukensis]|uniref:Uncharacterized protein n=1 Tax=Candidatus Heimdallarchaeum aukensis TaxID=2876573 RepID=A0A9Y1BKN9_9ARCH|nr:MAG: hypothetical protein K9W45_11640 [Candidatus Heimdallarchaeum aukensis]